MRIIKSLTIAALLTAIAFAASLQPAGARGLIRDAEIEQTLKRIAKPVLRSSGLGTKRVGIYIYASRELNAFATLSEDIFLNAGLLARLKTPEMIQAVIAHEAAHITGGHVARRFDRIRGANRTLGLGIAMAIAAGLAGQGEVAAASVASSAQVAKRGLLAHSRAEEASADQAGISYLARAGIDPQAAIEVLSLFRGQELLAKNRVDPYALTHPLSSERIRLLKERAANIGVSKVKKDPNLNYWHARMVAKFNGFLYNPASMLRRYKSDKSEAGALARAVAYHRLPKVKEALREINSLIKLRPKDPYYHELKGQILLESGRAREAAASYRKAQSLAPKEPQILAGLGRSLLALDQKKTNREALKHLENAHRRDGRDARVLRDLALAYARSGQEGLAALATAERYFIQGRAKDATRHAKRAEKLLPTGSPGWQRAQDLLSVANRTNG